MPTKILKQTGYPTTDGKSFQKHIEAIKHQTKINLDEAVNKCEGEIITQKFIKDNSEIVSEFIKYHCPKSPAKKRKPA